MAQTEEAPMATVEEAATCTSAAQPEVERCTVVEETKSDEQLAQPAAKTGGEEEVQDKEQAQPEPTPSENRTADQEVEVQAVAEDSAPKSEETEPVDQKAQEEPQVQAMEVEAAAPGNEAQAEVREKPDEVTQEETQVQAMEVEAAAEGGEAQAPKSEVTEKPDEVAQEEPQVQAMEVEATAEGGEAQAPKSEVTEKPHEVAQEEPQVSSDGAPAGEAAQLEPKTPQTKKVQKRSAAKSPDLEVMAAKIKRLREEADQADAAIAEEVKKLEELQARIATMRSEADAKRAAAQRAAQEYSRKQCEGSIAHLESSIPKRSPNPFVMFRAELSASLAGLSRTEFNKKIAEGWANLSAEEKQKYKDRQEAGNKRYNEWGNSEEGQKNLRERSELIKQCKATSIQELGEAIKATDGEAEPAAAKSAKRAAPAKKDSEETPTKEMPAKRRRAAPAKPSPSTASPTKEPVLDEAILEEASKADLTMQLRNLAARPEVLALGKSSQQLWDILRAHSGMVNAAKHALLSAAS